MVTTGTTPPHVIFIAQLNDCSYIPIIHHKGATHTRVLDTTNIPYLKSSPYKRWYDELRIDIDNISTLGPNWLMNQSVLVSAASYMSNSHLLNSYSTDNFGAVLKELAHLETS